MIMKSMINKLKQRKRSTYIELVMTSNAKNWKEAKSQEDKNSKPI